MGARSDVVASMKAPMILDLVIALILAFTFFAGARRGLIVGVFGFIGYVGGAIGAMALAPRLLHSIDGSLKRALLTGLLVIIFASLGQVITTRLGGALRKVVLWGPLRFIDSLLGGVLAVLSVVVLLWIFATVANLVGSNSVASLLNHSSLVRYLDNYLPHQLTNWAKTEATRLVG